MLNKNVDPVNNLTKIKNPPPPFASPPCHYPLPLLPLSPPTLIFFFWFLNQHLALSSGQS